MHRLLISVAILALSACAARGVVEEPETTAQLGFLNGPDVNRSYVEARLGAPAATYEGGTVVSYMLYMWKNRLSSLPESWMAAQYALLLLYDTDGRLVRRALTRRQ
jgi:hypothetical protein